MPALSTGIPDCWTGRWVAERLDAVVATTAAPFGVTVADLVGLALRRNSGRPHLLVSGVLGKHVPADPRLIMCAGRLLGRAVRSRLTGQPVRHGSAEALRAVLAGASARAGDFPTEAACPAVVLGYAETATGLGHAVADELDAVCLHSTRRTAPDIVEVGTFLEEHSHAREHRLLPRRRDMLLNDLPLVLVDDELSTGTTAMNTIALLNRLHPRDRYVIASFVDVRSAADRDRMAEAATSMGTRVDVVALATGKVTFADGAAHKARELTAVLDRLDRVRPEVAADGVVRRIDIGWPTGLSETGRHGFTPEDRSCLDDAVATMTARIEEAVSPTVPAEGSLSVLGVEELMYAPQRIAAGLANRLDHIRVRFSTTTRSPVLAVDADGYAIRSKMGFAAHDNASEGGTRYAYNLRSGGHTVLLVLDEASDTAAAGDLIRKLTHGFRQVLVTTIGPTAWSSVR